MVFFCSYCRFVFWFLLDSIIFVWFRVCLVLSICIVGVLCIDMVLICYSFLYCYICAFFIPNFLISSSIATGSFFYASNISVIITSFQLFERVLTMLFSIA